MLQAEPLARSTVLIDLVPLLKLFNDEYDAPPDANESAFRQFVESGYDKAIRFLKDNNIPIWEAYPAFVMSNVTTADINWLIGLGLGIWPLNHRTEISKDSWHFDTRTGEPDLPADLKCGSVELSACGLGIVQFIGPVKDAWLEALTGRGAVPVRYLPNFAFIMKVPQSLESALSTFPFVQWVAPYHPAYRLSSEFLVLSNLWSSSGPVVVESLTKDVDALNTTLTSVGVVVEGVHLSRDRVLLRARADLAAIKDAARIPEVLWIEPAHGSSTSNNQAVWVVQSGVSGSTPVHARNLRGQGQIITVMDTGLDVNHAMFLDPEGDPVGPQHRKVVAYYEVPGGSGDDIDSEEHGTHVAGSALGDAIYCLRPDNCYYGTYNAYDGMAFGAKIIVQDKCTYEFCAPDDPTPAYDAALVAGSSIHTNSWGRTPLLRPAKYTWYDNYLDNFVRQNYYFLVLHAAGNEGDSGAQTLREEPSAKNLLSVGATGNGNQANNIPSWSSRGGTGDARLKPNVVAPGEGITSADAGGSYVAKSGTSMATPIVAGGAALVRQYFTEGWYPTGQPTAANAFLPSAALIRAMIINGAVEISGTGAYRTDQSYPNNDQGWGRIHLDNSLYFPGDSRGLYVVDHARSGLATGQWIEFPLEVASGQPFEVTLAWSDPGAVEACNPCLVNNLDLLVTDPSGNQYKGNVFSGMNPGQSIAGGSYDSRNVEEGVLRLNPAQGTWRIRVTATNVPSGPQDFALVVTGGLLQSSEVQVSTWKDHSVVPASVVDSSGRVHMVWQDRAYGNYDPYYARLSATGTLEIRKQLSGLGNEETDLAIALNPLNGEVWIVHRRTEPSHGNGGIFYHKSSDSGVSWQGPGWVSDVFGSSQDHSYPSIAIDSNGRKHVVMRQWQLSGNTEYERLQYYWTDASSPQQWDWTRSYVSPTYQHSYTPCVDNPMILDPNIVTGRTGTYWDELHVVYGTDPAPECSGSWVGTTYTRYVRSLNRGSSWQAEVTLGTTRDLARPNTVAAYGANVFASWHDWDTGAFDIFFTRSTNGGTSWASPTKILSGSQYQVFPNLDYTGTVLALVWADNQYGNYEVFVRKSTDHGVSWNAITRFTNHAATSYYPHVRLSNDGAYYMVAWADARNNGNSWYDVYYRRLAA